MLSPDLLPTPFAHPLHALPSPCCRHRPLRATGLPSPDLRVPSPYLRVPSPDLRVPSQNNGSLPPVVVCQQKSLLCCFVLGEFPKEYVSCVLLSVCAAGVLGTDSSVCSNRVCHVPPLSLSLSARLMLASHLRKLHCGDSAGQNPGQQDDAQAAQQLPCLAATFCATATFAVLTVLAVTHMLHAQMHAECVPRSLAAQHYTYNEQLWRRS